MANIAIQFKSLFNYSDLKGAPKKGKKKKRNLETMLSMQSVIYILRKNLLKKAWIVKDEAIIAY